MPLDIMPALAAPPGGAPPGPADSPPGGLPLVGAGALLFGLLLAQTVGQAAAKAAPAAGQSAPTLIAVPPAATPQSATAEPSLLSTPEGKTGREESGKTNKKDKINTVPTEAPPVPGLLWTPPAPVPAPMLTLSKTLSGKAMDAVSKPSGELLSSSQVNVPTETVIVPSEPDVPQVPDMPQVPVFAVTPPQPVVASDGGPARLSEQVPTQDRAVPTLVTPGPFPAPAGPRPATLPLTVTLSAPAVSPPPASTSPAPSLQQVPLSSSGAANMTVSPVPPVPAPAALSAPPRPGAPANSPVSGLQNRVRPADNQAGKNTDVKSTGPTRVIENTVSEKQPSKERPVPEIPTNRPVQSPVTDVPSVSVPVSTPTQGPNEAPMPPAARTLMLGQIEHSITTMTVQAGGRGPQQVTLQLHPKDWGQLNVSVTLTPQTGADGKVSTQVIAHVVAEHPAVKAALEMGREDLRHSLREAGLSLDRLTVTVQAPTAGSETSAGGSRHESRGGEAWGGGQSRAPGTETPGGGSPSGGNNPSPSTAFAQDGRPNQRPPSSVSTPAASAAEPEPPTTLASIAALTGRIDTRA